VEQASDCRDLVTYRKDWLLRQGSHLQPSVDARKKKRNK
jgi:hypothetical protein